MNMMSFGPDPLRYYSPEFRAKVAFAALQTDKLVSEICLEFNLHSAQVTEWKRQLLDGAPGIFAALDAKKPRKESAVGKALSELIR